MLEAFLAGFLGIICGAGLISGLFYKAYLKEREIAEQSAEKLYKLMSGDVKTAKTNPVLSLFKNDDKKPVN